MAKSSKKDKFPNRAVIKCVQSAADTITFQELHMGMGMFQKAALVIHRVEYDIGRTGIAAMTTATDHIIMGLTRSDTLTSIHWNEVSVIDACELLRVDFGTAASGTLQVSPEITRDFSTMPGGGLIIPAAPLFLGVDSDGLATPATVFARIFFTIATLSPSEYWELVESVSLIA